MEYVGDTVLFVAGVIVVLGTFVSAVRTTVLPRGVSSRITRQVFLWTRVVFRLRVGRSASYEKRDRIMAMYAPAALIVLLSVWLGLLILSYTAMFSAIGVGPLSGAFELSGSSIFTLGTTTTGTLGGQLLSYSEAGLGLLLLTLLITYLPTIYTTFQRRESAVTLLEVRAGNPPSAVNLLVRFHRIEKLDQLNELWRQWEGWFAELEESHISFPSLAYFRSPQPEHSWTTAAGAVLDAGSIWASTVEHPRDPDVQLMIRAGSLALRRIAAFFAVPFDADPAPDDPISISHYEYNEACRELAEAGVPLKDDLEASWKSFAGWRVNYDTPLLNLARLTEAPIAPWTSDRSPVGPDRTWTFRRALQGGTATNRGRRSYRRAREA
jgi:hypothetical protein